MNANDVLQFWFEGDPTVWRGSRWFHADTSFDTLVRERFEFELRAALDGALDAWADTPHGTLALIITFDQFPRNIHRGTHMAFAGDAHARRVARSAVAGGTDAHLTPVQRVFLYMPFMHSEDAADQDASARLFASLAGEVQLEYCIEAARRHREVIVRFGRFPHRNAILGRDSTPAEVAYLAEPRSGF